MAAPALLVILLLSSFVQPLFASDPLFYESFDETFEGRWVASDKDDYKADDEKVAKSYREKTWKLKYDAEKEKQKAEEAAAGLSDGLSGIQKKLFDVLYKIADLPFLEAYKIKIIDLIEKGEKQPNLTNGILVSIAVVILTIIFKILFGGKKKPVAPAKAARETTENAPTVTDNQEQSSEKEEEKGQEDTAAPRPTRSRRET